MDLFLSDHQFLAFTFLALLAFAAGFIDAVVGGGGLIQLPALLISLPQAAVPVLFGTNKIAALSGTSVAAFQYSKKIKLEFGLLLAIAAAAFLSSFAGAATVGMIKPNLLKPVILIILVLIAIYTFLKKDLGQQQGRVVSTARQITMGILIGLGIGFYDGFFGPGTGSFFVLAFVLILGMEFVQASAYAKVINCITNLSALIVFVHQGAYILDVALVMGLFNIAGGFTGSRMALRRGNTFIRIFFLVVVLILIVRYGWDVYHTV